MGNKKDYKLKIKGGKPLYGEYELSGDPVNAVALMVKALMHGDGWVHITNVPRVQFVFDFLKIIDSIGGEIEWVGVDEVKVNTDKPVASDISYLND